MNRERVGKMLVVGVLLLLAAAWRVLPQEGSPHPGAFFVSWPEPEARMQTESPEPEFFPDPAAMEIALR